MEYASVVWDPHQNYLIDKLEKVQNQCARFVLNYYELGASVTNMKHALHWEKLSERRKLFRMKFLDDIYNNRLLINRDVFLHEPFYVSERADHPKKIRPYSCRNDTFAFSFFPKTIEQWNRLPKDVLAANLVFLNFQLYSVFIDSVFLFNFNIDP
uniref:Putative endonuclease/reverse transcript n=1 Tax=Ixodes ricinus TaxID=34613 RepID=A0A6B0UWC2_IXORI